MAIWYLWTLVAPTIYAVAFGAGYFVYLQGLAPIFHHWAGVFSTFTGFALWIIARMQLGRAFAINPQATQLITSGLYAKFRHPIYNAEMLAFAGVTIFLWDPYVLVAILFLACVNFYRLRTENKLLCEKFGAQYERHIAQLWF